MKYQAYLMLFVFVVNMLFPPSVVHGMVSANYSISSLQGNYGSGSRNSSNYSTTIDIISKQPIGTSTSTNYILNSGLAANLLATGTSCGIYINAGAEITNSTSVNLGLICSDPTGCDEVLISNNGVGWSDPEAYTTSKSWALVDNDGERTVFVKFKNGLSNWSGVCHDSIILDTTPPLTTTSPVGGTFMSHQSVALTASEPATIYYTTDGSVPDTSSAVYSAPVSISDNNVTLQAFAVDEAGNVGSVVIQDYEICNGSGMSISGVVTDATVNKTMPLVTISLNTGQTAATDINGNYSFTGLPRGYYTIESVTTASPGYVTYQEKLKLCQASITHDIVLTKDSTVFGVNTNSGYSADSVNTSTGNFVYTTTDMGIPGRGMSFVFERSYNSQDGTGGPLGYGWTHNYNISLSEEAGGEVVVRWGDGKTEVWTPDGSGGYDPMYGVYTTLINNPDNTFTVRLKDMIEYHFDTSGSLESIVDEYGNAITFNYTGTEITSVTNTVGRTISFTYDASNRITSILDPIGRSVTYSYDANGDLVSSTDLDGKTTAYTYDSNHQMLTLADPKGNAAVTNVYDDQRRVVASQKDALGGETLYTYDVENKKTKIIDPLGNISYHYFDDMLRLIQEEDAKGNSAFYEFDERGSLVSVTDKRGNVTSYTYDANGNVLTKTEPLGRITSATYDSNNNPLTKTDANGNIMAYEYDLQGNLTTSWECGQIPAVTCKTDPLVNKTTYTYDGYGQLKTVTDALNNVTTYEYDVFGNRVAVIDALDNRSTFTYDGVGRKLTENHPLGRSTAFDYDNMDRLISVTDALGGQSIFTFDANGNKTEHTDARGNKTIFAYDAKNRLISKTSPLNETELYSYDSLDRQTAITNPNGVVSSVVYDSLGNVLQEIDAHGNTVRHEYDANGNKIKTVDALRNVTTFVYDALNRLESTTDHIGNTTSYTYDLNGNRLSTTDALGNTTTYTYDHMNRLKTVKDHLNNTTTNEYDILGRLVRVIDPEGRQTEFEYDEIGRLIKVIDAELGEVTAEYDAIGNRTSLTDTRGKITNYTYDVLNRLTSETDSLGNAMVMTYDAVGNLTSLSDSNGTTSYSYDENNRLEIITYPDLTTVTYSYDANGNRLSTIDSMGTTSYTYNELDQITSVTDPFGMTVGYTYNPVGIRTAIKYPGNRIVSYTYDELNRLSDIQDWGGITTSYEYDDAGRLVSQTMGNGSTVTYVYDEAGRLTDKEDRNASDNVIASYSYTLDNLGNRTGLTMNQPLVPKLDIIDDTFTHNDGNQVVASSNTSYAYDGQGNRITKVEGGSSTTQYAYNYDDMLVRVVKDIDASVDIPGNAIDVTVVGNVAYVVSDNYGLRTIDISNPANPQIIGVLQPLGNLRGISAVGDRAYVTRNLSGLQVIDVSDPANPRAMGSVDTQSTAKDITVVGNRAYVADGQGGGLQIIDVSDPANPWVIGWVDTADAYGIAVVGNIAYVADMSSGLKLVDVSDPADPRIIGSVNTPGLALDVTVVGDMAYVADYTSGLQVIDVSNLANLRIIGSMNTPDRAYGISVVGDRAYVADQYSGLQVIDVSNPANLRIIGSVDTPGRAVNVTVADDRAYVADMSSGLQVIDVSNPSSPGNVNEHRYNSDGFRLSSIDNEIETRYLLDQIGDMEYILAEMDDSNSIQKYYIYGDGLLYSIDGTTGERLFYHYDPIGSTVAITDINGNITDKYAYLPFGKLNRSETVHDNKFTYVGKYGVMQEPNGLYFMRARFYDPETRRFLSKDPVKGDMENSQSLSPYIYVEGRPSLYIDPQGETLLHVIAGIIHFAIIVYHVLEGIQIVDGPYSNDEEIGDNDISINPYDTKYHKNPIQYAEDYYGNKSTSQRVNEKSGVSDFSRLNLQFSKQKTSSVTVKKRRRPKEYLDVRGYASGYFNSQFAKLKDPDLFDKVTRSYIELSIEREIYELQKGRYGYRTNRQEDEMRRQMRSNVSRSSQRLYSHFLSTLSKHHVIIRDLAELPKFNSGNVRMTGVYAGR